MEISDRKELDKLIAYSKSFRPQDLEPDFEDQYTPPGHKHFLFDLPQTNEVMDFDLDNTQTEEQLLAQLKMHIGTMQCNLEGIIPEEESDCEESQLGQVEEVQTIVVVPQIKSETTMDLTEFNKVGDDVLMWLDKTKGRKSLLAETIRVSNKSMGGRPNMGKPIKIFYFNTPANLTINAVRSTTVGEILKQAIKGYQEGNFDQKLLKYPQFATEAYEVRILDDDFDYRADMSFAALDKRKEILSTQTTLFAVIEVNNFKPPANDSLNQAIEKISQDKNMIVIDITIVDEDSKINSKIQLPKESLTGDIIEKLSKRNKKINARDFIVQIKTDDYSFEIDLKIPVSQLTGKQIIVSKKVWADQSQSVQQVAPMESLMTEQNENSSHEAPLNHIQAFKYEKFTVVKINERGKRQDRILGIDQFRIYNMNKKESLGFFEKIIANKETGTKYPERLIEDVIDLRVASQFLYITFKQDDSQKERFKELKFDTQDPKIAQKITKKINFIRDYQSQTQSKKLRGYSQKFE